jgi:hypothetical protein
MGSRPPSTAPRSLAEELEELEQQLHMLRTKATALAASAETLDPRGRWFCVSATLTRWVCELAWWEEVLADKATALRNASCQEVRHG